MLVSCQDCPLRTRAAFHEHAGSEVALIESLKRKQIVVQAGQPVIHEGQPDAPLFTLLQGWAFRFRTLADGRRQILNFLLPGDLIGLQQHMGDASTYGVQALSDVLLCVFDRDALRELQRAAPTLGFGVTWLAAREDSIAADALQSASRRSAEERIAALLIVMFKRLSALLPEGGAPGVPFPLSQQHIADALGLSLAHTHKTLRKLEKRGLHRVEVGRLYLLDLHALPHLAELYGDGKPAPRPLI